MSIRDSIYTNPDALRAKYLRPKNVLQNIDEATASNEATMIQTGAIISSNNAGGGGSFGSVGGGSGSYGGSENPVGCPALTEFVLARYSDRVVPKLVGSLRNNLDHLWNPLTQEFQLLYFSEVLESKCFKVTTIDNASQIVSWSHPVIQSFSDQNGLSISEIRDLDTRFWNAVSCINFTPNATLIKRIDYAGIRKVLKLSLNGSHIYASGTKPMAMLLGHNSKPLPGDGSGIDEFLT